MKFNFIGKIDANDMSAKVPFYREITNGASLNLICIEGQNNRAFMELAGFKNDPIKTMDTENNKIEIDWDDRLNEDTIKKVAGYKKHIITLNGKRYEFISELDMVNFIKEHIDEIKGKKYHVTGNIKKNEYKGKITDGFQIQNMYEADDDKKNSLTITGDFYFNKESIDTSEWKEQKLYLNGWTSEWMNKEHPSAMLARTLVFDCSKIDFSNEQHVEKLAYRLKQLGCALDEKNKVVADKLKKNKHYKIAVICRYLNGNEEAEFTEADLTQNQKDAIALGIAKLEDFKPSGRIYGDRVTILKLRDFDLRGDYANGCVDAGVDDFEDLIYTPSTSTESAEEAFTDTAMNPPEEDEESLFD